MKTKPEVSICLNCKDMWIAPIYQCTCGHRTFGATNETNRPLAKNFQVERLLLEYGFKRDIYNNNFHLTIESGKIIDVDMLHGTLNVSITDINDYTVWLDFIDNIHKLKTFLNLLN